MNLSTHQQIIEAAFEHRSTLKPANAPPELRDAVRTTINALNTGELRVAEPSDSDWRVNQWVKQAILLHFRLANNAPIDGGFTQYFDKVRLKYAEYQASDFQRDRVRIVPPACIREGVYIAPDAVIMPSYINIGAHIGAGSMVDTWATVGSCAQIGQHVHLSGGVGIGGVLEPLQANPTIIEDNCFIGARSEIVEGVIVGRGSVIAMGVYIGQSTKLYHRETGEITTGHVPAGSVVVPGSLPAADGSHSIYAAIIVKTVDDETRSKTRINDLLRDSI